MRKNKLFSSKYDENKDDNLVMLGKNLKNVRKVHHQHVKNVILHYKIIRPYIEFAHKYPFLCRL